jgi:hypothetical protein
MANYVLQTNRRPSLALSVFRAGSWLYPMADCLTSCTCSKRGYHAQIFLSEPSTYWGLGLWKQQDCFKKLQRWTLLLVVILLFSLVSFGYCRLVANNVTYRKMFIGGLNWETTDRK